MSNRRPPVSIQFLARIHVQLFLVAMGWQCLFPALQSTAIAQETDFRDFFPQIENADWEAISQGCPIDHEENETLTRILDGSENVPEKYWKSAAQSNSATLADAVAAPTENCGKIFSVSGKCVQVKPPWQNRESSSDSGTPELTPYQLNGQRILIKCDDGTDAWVLAQSIPRHAELSSRFRDDRFEGQPVSCVGMFLFEDSGNPVLVARQIHWRPNAVSPDLNIGTGQLELVRAGFDLELLDQACNYTDMALIPEEKELFERMLAATHTLSEDPDSALQGQGKPFDLIDLVRQPVNNGGSLIQVEGMLRRYASVVIDDPDLRKAINGESYYQLDVFVPLGNQRIQVGHDTHNNPIETTGEYGITLIATRLPEEILGARLPIRIQVPAFMLKVWEHTSLSTSIAPQTLRRPNPILVAVSSQLQIVPVSDSTSPLYFLFPSIGFGVLGILCILFFVSRNRSHSFHTQKRTVENPDFGGIFEDDGNESQACP